jgi:hypothetical protein
MSDLEKALAAAAQASVMNSHKPPAPSTAALIDRLAICAASLDHLAAKAVGEYKPYFADRAQQCHSWLADLQEGRRIGGHRLGDEDIIGGLREFEAMAL